MSDKIVGLNRGLMSKLTTSYPNSCNRFATDPEPQNKSNALFLSNAGGEKSGTASFLPFKVDDEESGASLHSRFLSLLRVYVCLNEREDGGVARMCAPAGRASRAQRGVGAGTFLLSRYLSPPFFHGPSLAERVFLLGTSHRPPSSPHWVLTFFLPFFEHCFWLVLFP